MRSLAGYSHLGLGKQVLEYFSKMTSKGIKTDYFTLASALQSTGILYALEIGKQIHVVAFKDDHFLNVNVQNGLVSMYERCGSLDDAKMVFSFMDEHDIILWNYLLSGCAHHKFGLEVINLFEQMKVSGVEPDGNTFLSVFSVCIHGGLVQKGLQIFSLMKENYPCQTLKMEHYASIVDLFARAGHLHEAEDFINNMSIKPGLSVYKSLLSGCRIYGDMRIVKRASKWLMEFYPKDSAAYVLLSSSFAKEGCWDEAEGVRKLMQEKRMVKNPACTWIGFNKDGGNAAFS